VTTLVAFGRLKSSLNHFPAKHAVHKQGTPQAGAWNLLFVWVGVFTLTVEAHREIRHGGLGAVVWDVLDDGEARSTVGAVDEGVAIAAVVRVKHLAQTIWADGDVWRDRLERTFDGGRMLNVEGREIFGCSFSHCYFVNHSQRRLFTRQFFDKGLDGFLIPSM